MATREDELDLKIGTTCAVRHSLGTDEVDINDSNHRLSVRARLSDNCLKIMEGNPSGSHDLPFFIVLMARLTESGVKETFVIIKVYKLLNCQMFKPNSEYRI